MESAVVKSHVESVCPLPEQTESTVDILARQVRELEYRADKYFQHLENVEEMCEQAQADIKRFQLEADERREIVKRDAEVQAKLYSAFKEMNERVKKLPEGKDATLRDGRIPDAVQNALRYTTSARVCRYIKIGCALVFDTVAAYALFKITKPLFF